MHRLLTKRAIQKQDRLCGLSHPRKQYRQVVEAFKKIADQSDCVADRYDRSIVPAGSDEHHSEVVPGFAVEGRRAARLQEQLLGPIELARVKGRFDRCKLVRWHRAQRALERVMGIEPTYSAW